MPASPRVALEASRALAVERLARVADDLVALRADRAESADDEHDPEGTPLSAEWSRLTGLRSEARDELAAIDDALARVDAGIYGQCVDCGAAIPRARLEARPTAVRCIACATRAGG